MYLVATIFLFISNAKAVLNCVESVQQGKTFFATYVVAKRVELYINLGRKGPNSQLIQTSD